MHHVCPPKRLLAVLLAVVLAAVVAQAATAQPRVIPYLSHGIGVNQSLYRYHDGMWIKQKHLHPRVVVTSTQAGTWSIPSGCTLGLADGYVWGYTCSGNSANGSTKAPAAAPASRTDGNWSTPCTLGLTDGYVWGFTC